MNLRSIGQNSTALFNPTTNKSGLTPTFVPSQTKVDFRGLEHVADIVGKQEIAYNEITTDQLAAINPPLKKNPAKLKLYTDLLNAEMKAAGINTPSKQAQFLATVGAESIGMSVMIEGKKTRYKSSPTGWHGRGWIQITHRENYARADKDLQLGGALLNNREMASKPEIAAKVATWFWAKREHPYGIPINMSQEAPAADLIDFRKSSSLVNSGRPDGPVNHYGTRLIYYKRALEALKVPISDELRTKLDSTIKEYPEGKHLKAEPSYFEWKREQRAKCKAGNGEE